MNLHKQKSNHAIFSFLIITQPLLSERKASVIHKLVLYLIDVQFHLYVHSFIILHPKKESTTTSSNKQLLFLLGSLQMEMDASLPVGKLQYIKHAEARPTFNGLKRGFGILECSV